jgi:hypothetical protein
MRCKREGRTGPRAKGLDLEVLIRLNVLTTNNAMRQAKTLGCLRNLALAESRAPKTKEITIMKIIQKIGILSLTFCLMAGFAQAASKSMGPNATLQLSSGAVAAGVGISWGKGTLTYKGKQYPVSVSGLSLGKVGITKVTASGEVYHLKRLQDFSGTYTSATADITLAGGRSGVTMKNQNGVLVVVHATSKGVDLTIGGSGVEMKLKK